MQVQSITQTQPDLAAVKARQQPTWASGDYAVIGTTLQLVGESLCEALDLRPGEGARRRGRQRQRYPRAARRCVRCRVDRLCAGAARWRPARAGAEGLTSPSRKPTPRICRSPTLVRRRAVDLRRDVHAEPGAGGSRAGARVQARRPDRAGQLDAGRLSANMFKRSAGYLPPPAGVKSPALWGTEARLRELFPGHEVDGAAPVFTLPVPLPGIGWILSHRLWAHAMRVRGTGRPKQQDALRSDLLDS